MKTPTADSWAGQFRFEEDDKLLLRSIETSKTRLSEDQWVQLIQFIEKRLSVHMIGNRGAGVVKTRDSLKQIEGHFSHALSLLRELDREKHSLLKQHFFLTNGFTIPELDIPTSEISSYQKLTEDLLKGVTSYKRELEKYGPSRQGEGEDFTYTNFLVELMRFLAKNNYPIVPRRNKNTLFHKLTRLLFQTAFNKLQDPIRHIERAFDEYRK